MKLERSNVEFPIWRKKVDSSLLQHKGTTIPNWACSMWDISLLFSKCSSKKDPESQVKILFDKSIFKGQVTIASKGRKTPAYRLWFADDLQMKLKETFPMTFMRDIENRLRKEKKMDIEEEIPFWEFLDIEFDKSNKQFIFNAYYTQKPSFPELFKRIIGSPMIHKIDDELNEKPPIRIYKQDWKSRDQLDYELEAENTLYTLLDTKNKLIYIGEAKQLVKRLKGSHPSIPGWDYYRYEVLPNAYKDLDRVTLERMLIRYVASIFPNKTGVLFKTIDGYTLSNDKIDSN